MLFRSQGTADFDPGPGTAEFSSAGSHDVFVSKLDGAGNFVWARQLGGSGWDEARGIALDGSGNVSNLNDKSGNARNLSQGTAANRPTYSRLGFNSGYPTFDWGTAANSKGLSNTTLSAFNPARVFGVFQYAGPNPFTVSIAAFNFNFSGISGELAWFTNNTGQNWYTGFTNGLHFLNGSTTSSSVALPTISSPCIAANDITIGAGRTAIYFGIDRNNGGSGWIGKISEVLAIGFTPSTQDRNQIEEIGRAHV